jgi:hypothetical protein
LTVITLAITLALAPGCIHVHTDADGNVKSVEMRLNSTGSDGKAPDKTDTGVKQASASVPTAPATPLAPTNPTAPTALSSSLSFPSLSKLTGGTPSVQAAEMAVVWDNHLAHLPDPTKNGAEGPGLIGQLFLFGAGPKMPFAPADGNLTVEMFDETPRPGFDPEHPTRLGGWTFGKEALRRLVTNDERFGKCYALFLPWPDFRPDITRVKLTTRYEPEHGHKLFAQPTPLMIDLNPPGGGPSWSHMTVPVSDLPPSMSALGGPPAANVTVPTVGFSQPNGYGPPGGGGSPSAGFGLPIAPSGGPR